MKGKNLQLAGIIIYAILAVISVLGFFDNINYESISYHIISVIFYIVLFQLGIVFLIMNYFKNNKDGFYGIIIATVARIFAVFPLLFIAAFNDSGSSNMYYIIYVEIVAKIILGIYNIAVTKYVLSKNKILEKLLSQIKVNKNVTIIAKYKKICENTITLVYKTIDGMPIENLEQITQNVDYPYKVNLINLNDIKDEEKYDDIILTGIELYNDGRLKNIN